MPIPAVIAAGIANKIDVLADSAVKGLGQFKDGIVDVVNGSDYVPQHIGMTSTDFTKVSLAALMSAQNNTLNFARHQLKTEAFSAKEKKELRAAIEKAEEAHAYLLFNHGRRAMAQKLKNKVVNAKPTQAELEKFYKLIAKKAKAENTQRILLKLYSDAKQDNRLLGNLGWTWKGLLKSIVTGVEKIFGYVDKAKTIYEKAKPFVENLTS